MSRLRRVRRQLRDDAGYSITELLVAMIIGVAMIFGILSLLDTSISLSTRTQQRVDATQRGRLALDLMTRELRSQACLSESEPPLVAGADRDITFYVNLGTVDQLPEKHQIALESGDLILRRWVGVAAAAGVTPSVTYPVTATTTSILASNVQEVPGVPLFRYYSWNAAANPLPDALLATPLSVANAPRSVKVAMSFRVLPDRAFNTNRPTATFEDVAYSRLADPAKPAIGPFCG